MGTHYYSDMVNQRTCVYRAYIGDHLAYIGLSLNPDGRFAAHSWRKPWWKQVTRIEMQWFEGREAAKTEERAAIANEAPLYNVVRPKAVRV